MRNKVVVAVLLIAAVAAGGFFYNKYRVAPEINFDALVLQDMQGHEVKLKELNAQKVFVNFFGTWCGPCMAEMPSLGSAADKLKDKGYLFVIISDEPIERLKAFAERAEDLPLLLLRSEKRFADMGIYSIPVSYLLDKNGRVLLKKSGSVDWAGEEALKEIQAAI